MFFVTAWGWMLRALPSWDFEWPMAPVLVTQWSQRPDPTPNERVTP